MRLLFISMLVFFQAVRADDGLSEKFKKLQMNINEQNYVIFEDSSLIVASRDNDVYLVEITPKSDLYIHGEKIDVTPSQKKILSKYFKSMRKIFHTRNRIGGKAIKVGIAGAKLAVKAVGGLVDYVLSGFDDEVMDEFEKEMDRESERIDAQGEHIDDMGKVYKKFRRENNKIVDEIRDTLPVLDSIRLEINEEDADFQINIKK